MLRSRLRLSLFAVFLTACSASATPATEMPSPTMPPSPTPSASAISATQMLRPTMSPSSAQPPFIVLAYATDAIVAETIPYAKLTHINYSFLTPKADGTFNPINNDWKLKQIVQAARTYGVRVSISVGGWGWDEQFEQMAAKPESRNAFVRNLKAFIDEYQLAGADIDWEYPDPGPSSQNFLALIQELRAALPDKLLTAAVVAYGDDIGSGIPGEAFPLLDFVNVMTYDGPDHGTMEQFEKGLSYWSGRGLPKEKIVMGVPFYGKPDTPYFKIVRADPSAAQVDAFKYMGTTVHYNGIPTVQAKTRIAMEKAAGIMFWALDHDAQGKLSLVNAIYQAIHEP